MKTRRVHAALAAILFLIAMFVMPPAPAAAERFLAIDDGFSAPPQNDYQWFLQLSWIQRASVFIYASEGLSLPIP